MLISNLLSSFKLRVGERRTERVREKDKQINMERKERDKERGRK